ncbi:MAG: TolC family protein [Candidatus Binatia bacterium]|nr:TolC family protein [Candidatus Binatia bacterium]
MILRFAAPATALLCSLLVAGCSAFLGYESDPSLIEPPVLPAELQPEFAKAPPVAVPLPETELPAHLQVRAVTLQEVLLRAGEDSIAVLDAEAQLEAAAARTLAADAAFVPGVRGDYRAWHLDGRQVGSFGVVEDVAFGRFEAGLSVFYRLNPGGAVEQSISARYGQDAAAGDAGDSARRAMESAGLAYFDLLRSRAEVEIADQLVAATERFLSIARARAAAEVSSRADVARAEAELAAARQVHIRARGTWEVTSATLATLLRWDPTVLLAPAEAEVRPHALVEGGAGELAEHSTARRPDVRAAEARAQAALHAERSTWWNLLGPTIELEGRQRWLGIEADDLGAGTIGLAAIGWSFQLSELARVQEVAAEARSRDLSAAFAAEQARGQVQGALVEVSAAADAIPEANHGVRAAGRSWRIQIARFEAGTGLGLEVIEAQNAEARARLSLVTSILRYNAAQLRLLAASGLLDPDIVR